MYRSDRWQQLWGVFHRALESEPEKRTEYLIRACGSDSDLRREAEELLLHYGSDNVLDHSPIVEQSNAKEASSINADPEAGDVLAGRFQIIRVIGRGGVARVYEALDTELGTRVALKTLRSEVASDHKWKERLNREINLARRVTHPNACRIFDLFHHGDSLSFLTMELLEGETLYEYISRNGTLSASQAFPIIEQVAAALSAAHLLGIIHRDLKTTNIMLVPENSGHRAVVTDFGLATTADTGEFRLTGEGQILGTPEYMAPEQVQGGKITPATDIYALGLVMYEMLTGKLPFTGDTPFAVASQRLHTPAPSPRKYNPRLDRRWERTILRCLERDPGDRFQTPVDVVASLKGEAVPIRLFTKRRQNQLGIGLVVLVSVLIVFAILWQQRTQSTTLASIPFEERDWVLVCAFENKTGEPALDGTLEHALQWELSNSQFVNVIPEERVHDVLQLMKKPIQTKVHAGLGREICLRDGDIRALIGGRVERLGSTYNVSIRIVEPLQQIAVAGFSAEARGSDELFPAVRRLSSQVRASLGEQLSQIEKSEKKLESVTTPSLRALQLYSMADEMVAGKDKEAEPLLREAIAEDPEFASAYILLAFALRNQGRSSDEILPYADRALVLSKNVSERERYFIRGASFHLAGKWEEALANYQLLLKFYPDHRWANHKAAGMLRRLGRSEEAVPYLIREARVRPNSVLVNFDTGWYLAVYLNRWEEGKVYLRRVVELAAKSFGYEKQKREAECFIDLHTVHQHWLGTDVTSMLRLLDRWKERLRSEMINTPDEWEVLIEQYKGIGRFRAVEEIVRLCPDEENRNWFLRDLEYARSDASRWKTIMQTYPTPSAAWGWEPLYWARAGLPREAQKWLSGYLEHTRENRHLTPTPQLLQTIQGEIALAEGKTEKAISLLEEGVPKVGNDARYFWASKSLANAWLKAGNVESALAVLENASRQKNRAIWYKLGWLKIEFQLAQLYRKVGRESEAEKIEEELRKLLAYADSDFWMVKELNRIKESSIQRASR